MEFSLPENMSAKERRAKAEAVVTDEYLFEEIMADYLGMVVGEINLSGQSKIDNIFTVMSRNQPNIFKRLLNGMKNRLEQLIARLRGKDILTVRKRQQAERLHRMVPRELSKRYGEVKENGDKSDIKNAGKKFSVAGANSATSDKQTLAKFKSRGSSENMTRKSFESLYNENSGSALEKFNNKITSLAENADMWTWAKIWRMCKAEISAQGNYTDGREEYFKAVNRKFSQVIGKTQVVQSALDSSMAVQNAGTISKFLFAFQNEPLKQYSYLSSSIYDAIRGDINHLHGSFSLPLSDACKSAMVPVFFSLA